LTKSAFTPYAGNNLEDRDAIKAAVVALIQLPRRVRRTKMTYEMKQLRGLAGFMLLMLPPWFPFWYVRNFEMLSDGNIRFLLMPCVLSIVFSGFGVAFYFLFRARDLAPPQRLVRLNIGLFFLEIFFFYLLYSTDLTGVHCQRSVECKPHLLLWLSFAWMHLVYAIEMYVIGSSLFAKAKNL
jgi:hypothetical protein